MNIQQPALSTKVEPVPTTLLGIPNMQSTLPPVIVSQSALKSYISQRPGRNVKCQFHPTRIGVGRGFFFEVQSTPQIFHSTKNRNTVLFM